MRHTILNYVLGAKDEKEGRKKRKDFYKSVRGVIKTSITTPVVYSVDSVDYGIRKLAGKAQPEKNEYIGSYIEQNIRDGCKQVKAARKVYNVLEKPLEEGKEDRRIEAKDEEQGVVLRALDEDGEGEEEDEEKEERMKKKQEVEKGETIGKEILCEKVDVQKKSIVNCNSLFKSEFIL
eukprot:CAMPEP_0168355756 /NCGR_PEP_ID=MMETSP0213-20121227/24762_1 /TAXON_ID=151035 /ORGANISM="Euplotes harpa, Strain FSP1.4" /LENGTH=177 /DNA_ID=CAMNT_0008368071 /DNA_START=21 /DNA_END=554 /DNA_ORIENTATION=+